MVAKAMVHSPPILILDEPTAGVDVELRRQLWERVQELNALGVTIVLTTHYLEEGAGAVRPDRPSSIAARWWPCEPTPKLLRRLDTRSVVVNPASPLVTAPALPGLRRQAASRRPAGGELSQRGRWGSRRCWPRSATPACRSATCPPRTRDLEDVFLALTYGDASAASPTAY